MAGQKPRKLWKNQEPLAIAKKERIPNVTNCMSLQQFLFDVYAHARSLALFRPRSTLFVLSFCSMTLCKFSDDNFVSAQLAGEDNVSGSRTMSGGCRLLTVYGDPSSRILLCFEIYSTPTCFQKQMEYCCGVSMTNLTWSEKIDDRRYSLRCR